VTSHLLFTRSAFAALNGVQVESVLSAAMDKLAAQGSPNQIANFFRTEGIQGNPGRAYQCPVAMYGNRALGIRDDELQVVMANMTHVCVPLISVRIPTPYEVRNFMKNFDHAPGQFHTLMRIPRWH
jgi:hypothetical protein